MEQQLNHDMEPAKGTTKTYLIGFTLALVLTVFSFSMVFIHGISRHLLLAGIFAAALVQMVVHLHYFLHLDRSSAQRWNMIVLIFTALILFILVGGTLWVMYTLNSRMM